MKKGWRIVTLGEVCEFLDRRGLTPEKLGSRFTSDGFRVISAKNIKRREIDPTIGEQRFVDEPTYRRWMKSPLMADDVILTSEAPLGEPAYVDEELKWCLGQRLFGVRSDKSKLHGRFLFYAFQASPVRDDMLSRATGATAQGIRQSELTEVELPLPPLEEQQRIVWVLDEAFAGLATAQAHAAQNLQNARALLESHLHSIFTHRGKGWVEKRLGDVAEFKNGLNYTRDSKGQTLPVVGVGDFQSNNVVPMDELQTATIDGELSPEYALQRGDILTVRSNGSKNLVGRCMLVPEISRTTSYSGFIIRIRVNATEVYPAFMLHLMKSSDTRDRLTRDGGGANISNINQTKLAALPVSLPPVAEQERIVAQLDALAAETQRLTRLYERKQAALAALKKSLLHQAFTGAL